MLRSVSVLVLVALVWGCHPRGNIAHIDSPGTQIVSDPGSRSVVWSDGKHTRVCTLPTGVGQLVTQTGRHFLPAPKPAQSAVDAALFRLCEARGNGDLSAEQYVQAVDRLLVIMAHKSAGTNPHQMHPHHPGHGQPWGEAPGRGRWKRQAPPGLGPWPHGRCPNAENCPRAEPPKAPEAQPPETELK